MFFLFFERKQEQVFLDIDKYLRIFVFLFGKISKKQC